MANITIDNTAHATAGLVMQRAMVWTSSLVGYVFLTGALDANFYYRKTTDGGQTWGNRVTIFTGDTQTAAIWFDKWTTGDTGTKIHLAWTDTTGTDIRYNNLDTASDTLGTEVAVFGVASVAVDGEAERYPVDIVKARGGNLYIIFATHTTFTGNTGFYRSTDGGANWGSRSATVLEQAGGFWQTDRLLMVPGSEADANDIWCFYWDTSADEVSVKVHDDSANSWAETSVLTSTIDSGSIGDQRKQWSAVQRHSDNHVFIAIANNVGVATADIKFLELNGTASITTRTDVFTDSANVSGPEVVINGVTGGIYVFYANTNGTNPDGIEYKLTTDDGVNWGSAQQYASTAAVGFFAPWGGQYMTSGRVGAMWFDNNNDDLLFNYDNSIAIGGGGSQGSGGKGKGGGKPVAGDPPKKGLRTSIGSGWRWDRRTWA